MTTSFPGGLDAFTNPTSGDTLASPDHAAQHADVNDAVEALQAKVGVDGSAVTTSLDYKVGQISSLYVSKTNGTVTTASTSSNVVRNITFSTSAPTGGNDGDVWMVYS